MVRDVPVTPPELVAADRHAIDNFNDNWTLSTKLGVHLGDDVYAEATMRYIDWPSPS